MLSVDYIAADPILHEIFEYFAHQSGISHT